MYYNKKNNKNKFMENGYRDFNRLNLSNKVIFLFY